MTTAKVFLWGTLIGAVVLRDNETVAEFQYDADFTKSGIEISPLMMPLNRDRIYRFPLLTKESFSGLPGLLSDSLPDSFGNAVISAWLAKQGRTSESFNAVERLCYTGKRGMGALEYAPAMNVENDHTDQVYVDSLVELAGEIVRNRENLTSHFSGQKTIDQSFAQIMQLGTSAGGARAKAIISWNRKTGEIRSGQIDAGDGFEYYLMKFDGIKENKDKEEADGEGYTNLEYAYYLMAKDAGIKMTECELLAENKRNHFLTKRFDRDLNGNKIHMQTLAAIAHFDFMNAGGYSYEQTFEVLRRLDLKEEDKKQLFKRMVFNVFAMNHDDHVKNISFLMNRRGEWSLSPAYDVTFAYNPQGRWTSIHQMSINGKRFDITETDLMQTGLNSGLKKSIIRDTIESVKISIKNWDVFAVEAGVSDQNRDFIKKHLEILKY